MVHLIPVNSVKHRASVRQWRASRPVSLWWGNPAIGTAQLTTLRRISTLRLADGGLPVGYARWETVTPDTLTIAGLAGIPEGSIDPDITIGRSGWRGKGIGPAALTLIFDYLCATTKAPLVSLCTSVKNAVAHRAFEKADCRRIARFENETLGPCWVYGRRLDKGDLTHPLPELDRALISEHHVHEDRKQAV
ncbi:MAG: GNAT family protein [Pseudomonadota bacterium]